MMATLLTYMYNKRLTSQNMHFVRALSTPVVSKTTSLARISFGLDFSANNL